MHYLYFKKLPDTHNALFLTSPSTLKVIQLIVCVCGFDVLIVLFM